MVATSLGLRQLAFNAPSRCLSRSIGIRRARAALPASPTWCSCFRDSFAYPPLSLPPARGSAISPLRVADSAEQPSRLDRGGDHLAGVSPSLANLPFESCSALRGAAFKGGDRLHRQISPLRVAPHPVEHKGRYRLHRRISPLRVALHSAEQPSKAEIALTDKSPL